MSIGTIVQSLETLIVLHQELCEFSKQKTEIIKNGFVEKFQMILAEERKYVHKLSTAEETRRAAVEKWYQDQDLPNEEMTITNMLETITDNDEQHILEQLTIKLTKMITKLKQQEQLNGELIQQSMRFVQLSLDMLSPTIQSLNYGESQNTPPEKRSVFDSKA